MASPRQTRILVSSHDLRFFKPILNAWATNPAYETLLEEHRFHEITEPAKCQELLQRADVIFCEWCLGNAVWYSKHKRPDQKLIVRLHSQELRLPFLEQVNWGQVDRIILICPLHQKLLLERFPELETKSRLIYNPIDTRALDRPKLFGAEFNLGLLGMCPRLKAPHLAVELLSKLKRVDPRYTLFIKGKRPNDYGWLMQREEERAYYVQFFEQVENSPFRNSIVFEGYDSTVADWFSKIGFVLSTSEREGSHQSVAEGMASGALPIIRNWAGAELLYPDRFVFGDLEDAVKLVRQLKTVQTYREECRAVKEYAQKHFDQKVVVSQYEQVLAELDSHPDQPSPWIALDSKTASKQGEMAATTHHSSRRQIVSLYVCFLTPGKLNGYAIRVMEEAHALTTHGITVVIACFIANNPPCSHENADELKRQLEQRTGATCYLLPTSQFFKTTLAAGQGDTIVDTLVKLATTHQVDIIHGQALYSSLHALRVRSKVSAKIVFDVHGITPEEMQMAGAPALRVDTMTDCERHALQQADLRIFVSVAMRDFFRKKYALNAPNCVVPCGVHPERFAMTEEERLSKRKELGFEGKFVFLYLGTLSVWQWPEALFAVFAQFRRARPESLLLLLLPEGDHKQALSYCEKRGLPPGSYLLKEVRHHEVGLVAGAADAGLLLRKLHPVNAVASPTKFGEYLGAGVPVVVTEGIGDTSDLIRSEQVGLVVSPTDDGLAEADLERLLRFADEVKAHRSDWSRRTMVTARSHLGWTAGAQTLINQYRKLAAPPALAAHQPQTVVAET